jgi:hypothetical protein
MYIPLNNLLAFCENDLIDEKNWNAKVKNAISVIRIFVLVFAFGFLLARNGLGQLVPTTGVSYISSCGTTIYDFGGASANYSNNSSGTLIIRPTSMDQVLTVTGTYATELGFDYLRFDEGEDSNPFSYIGMQYSGSGTITPITASGPGIPLVVHFTSDGGVVSAGFSLTISCTCAQPTAIALSTTNAPCGGTGSVTVTSVTAPDQQPWIMTTFENTALPTFPW